MRRWLLRISVFVCALAVLSTVAVWAWRRYAPPVQDVPEGFWVDIFFREKIEPFARDRQWEDLRRTPLPYGDKEIRLWKGFGTQAGIDVFVLKRRSGHWSAFRMIPCRLVSFSGVLDSSRRGSRSERFVCMGWGYCGATSRKRSTSGRTRCRCPVTRSGRV